MNYIKSDIIFFRILDKKQYPKIFYSLFLFENWIMYLYQNNFPFDSIWKFFSSLSLEFLIFYFIVYQKIDLAQKTFSDNFVQYIKYKLYQCFL